MGFTTSKAKLTLLSPRTVYWAENRWRQNDREVIDFERVPYTLSPAKRGVIHATALAPHKISFVEGMDVDSIMLSLWDSMLDGQMIWEIRPYVAPGLGVGDWVEFNSGLELSL